MENHKRISWVQYLLVYVVALIPYLQTLQHGFVWDDVLVITQNEYTQKGISGIPDFFTKTTYLENRNVYRPIPQSLYAIEYEVFGQKAGPMHLMSLLWYALCCLLLFSVLKRLLFKYPAWLAMIAALIFAAHPLHTEVVANIKSRDEILALSFGLLTIRSSFWAIDREKLVGFLLAAIAMVIAILSKLNAITLIPLIPLVLWMGLTTKQSPWAAFKQQLNKPFHSIADSFRSDTQSTSLLPAAALIVLTLITLGVAYRLSAELLIPLTIVGLAAISWKGKGQLKSVAIILLSLLVAVLAVSFELGQLAISGMLAAFSAYLLNQKNKLLVALALMQYVALNLSATSHLVFTLPFPLVLCGLLYWLSKTKQGVRIIKPATVLFTMLVLGFSFLFIGESIQNPHFSFVKNPTEYRQAQPLNIQIEQVHQENQPLDVLNNILMGAENPEQRWATVGLIQLKYLQLLAWPHPLVHNYGIAQQRLSNFSDWQVWLSVAIHLALLAYALIRIRKKDPVALGILWYFVTISIFANVVVISPDTLAERFLFMPSVGFAIVLAMLLYRLLTPLENKGKYALYGLTAVLLATGIWKSAERSKDWKSNIMLTTNTLAYAPNNAAINANYGHEWKLYLEQNPAVSNRAQIEQNIIQAFNNAVSIYPGFANAWEELGTCYLDFGQPELAMDAFNRAYELAPAKPVVNYYLGLNAYSQQQYQQGILHLEKFLSIATADNSTFTEEERSNAILFLARCYYRNNMLAEAESLLNQAANEYPGNAAFYQLLANIYMEQQNWQLAESYLIQVLNITESEEARQKLDYVRQQLQLPE